MIRPGTNESLSSGQYAAMGNYIIMPQSALSGNPLSSQNQFQRQVQQYQVQQMGQQQILLPQVGGQFPMQGFPFLQTAMMPTPMISSHPSATHLVQHPAYTQRTNKLRPKASENIKLPNPLPECIEKMNVPSELYCPVCELSVNSQQQLTQHLGSTKHKLVSLGLLPKPSEDPNIKRVGQYKCKTCDVILNSEAQLVQHLKSLRHQAAERGEELPPRGERRFCPYQRKDPFSSKSGAKSGSTKLEDGVIAPPPTLDAPCDLTTDLTTVINSQGPDGHEMSHFCTNDENGNLSVDKKLSSDITKSPRLVENLIDSKDSIGNSRSPSYKSTEQ